MSCGGCNGRRSPGAFPNLPQDRYNQLPAGKGRVRAGTRSYLGGARPGLAAPMRKVDFYQLLTLIFFILAATLRVALFWANPPDNSFDDHYEPIFFILEEGSLPPKDACWECFQPPLFYVTSAALGQALAGFTAGSAQEQLKPLQFLPCLYGILSVYLTYLILKRLDISRFARTVAFGTVCFLPRHIYMSAMHTNDTLSILLVTLCAYLLLVLVDHVVPAGNGRRAADAAAGGRPSRQTILLALALLAAMLLALSTKSTALIVLPMVAAAFLAAFALRLVRLDARSLAAFALLVPAPALLVAGVALADLRDYGRPLPLNVELLDVNLTQPPGREGLSFFTFRPWAAVRSPILAPENVGSFWTLVTSRMWFDMEPVFLPYTDPNPPWWDAYDDYLNRHDRYEWPGEILLSPFTRRSGSALIALGLAPLALLLVGFARALLGRWSLWSGADPAEIVKAQALVALLLANLAGILFHTYRHPYYSFMKAAFILNSLAALALFLALGIMFVEGNRALRWGVSVVFALIFSLATIHILHIVLAVGSGAA